MISKMQDVFIIGATSVACVAFVGCKKDDLDPGDAPTNSTKQYTYAVFRPEGNPTCDPSLNPPGKDYSNYMLNVEEN